MVVLETCHFNDGDFFVVAGVHGDLLISVANPLSLSVAAKIMFRETQFFEEGKLVESKTLLHLILLGSDFEIRYLSLDELKINLILTKSNLFGIK